MKKIEMIKCYILIISIVVTVLFVFTCSIGRTEVIAKLEVIESRLVVKSRRPLTIFECRGLVKNLGPNIWTYPVRIEFWNSFCDKTGRIYYSYISKNIQIPNLRPGETAEISFSEDQGMKFSEWATYNYFCPKEYYCKIENKKSNVITYPPFKDRWPLRIHVFMNPCEAKDGDPVEFKVLIENLGRTPTPFIDKGVHVLSPARRGATVCRGVKKRYGSSGIIGSLPPGSTWISIRGEFVAPDQRYNGILATIHLWENFAPEIQSPWIPYREVPDRPGYFRGPCFDPGGWSPVPREPKPFDK